MFDSIQKINCGINKQLILSSKNPFITINMKYHSCLLICLLALFFATPILFAQAVSKTNDSLQNNESYQLIWSDEFSNEGTPDTLKWRFENGFVRNDEAQWYQKENAVCRNGFLEISGQKEQKPNPNYVAKSKNWRKKRPNIEYTSASLVMKKEHAFKYGKIEVRAKIDAQTGLWPAIWTLGIDGQWPANGEVDMMEYYHDSILANFAIAGKNRHNAIWDSYKKPLDSFGGKKWADDFHIWTLLWTETKMKIYLDDLLLNDIDLTKTFNKSDGLNPFRQPHYILLNLAMGGDRGGSLENTYLPSKYLVDYVRIYQHK
jgi:beta-glucanase (GH16 family)